MKEFEYPFDADFLLKKKKSLKRTLLADNQNRIKVKIAVLGGSTTTAIVQILDLFLLNYGIEAEFFESEYNHYYEDAVFDNETLTNFKPDLVYICTSNHNIAAYPSIKDDAITVDSLLDSELSKFKTIYDSLKAKFAVPILQNNFEKPFFRLLGNKDSYDLHGRVNFINRLNLELSKIATTRDDLYLIDLDYISSDYGLKKWSDPFYWYMYKYALAVPAIPYLSFNVANVIKSIYGKNKKGLVLDLDNTLWGGVVGDDGVNEICIGKEESEGQAFFDFQKYIKLHKDLGVLLNVDSKNDEKNALAGLNHPEGVLKPEDFICIKANWNSKDLNFKEIAAELNVLPESLVFVDDNPAERNIVTSQFNNVSAPEISDIAKSIELIDRSGFFETVQLSKDDLKRNEMYQENVKRTNFRKTFLNYADYLDSLNMKATIKPFDPLYIERIAQLTNKSNQFNLTTKRYTKEEIEQIALDSSYITLYGRLEDKFGDNGIVSIFIGRIEQKALHIELFLMSCRVLKRDMEYAMLDEIIKKANSLDLTKVLGYYYPTEKNGMVKSLYQDFGFNKVSQDDKENSVWSLSLQEKTYIDKNKHIQVN